jgi:hypothetical protein
MTIRASPPSDGTNTRGSRKLWVTSWDAPLNAATDPTVASPTAQKSQGKPGVHSGGQELEIRRELGHGLLSNDYRFMQ